MTLLAVLARVPTSPAGQFRCEKYACNLTGTECVKRQTHRQEGHGTWRAKGGFIPPHLQYCASGACGQGKGVRAAVGEVEIKIHTRDRKRAAATKRGRAVIAAVEEKLAAAPARVAAIVPATLPAAGPAKVITQAKVITKIEEEPVGEAAVAAVRKCRWTEEACDKQLRADNRTGMCKRHAAVQWARDHRVAKGKAPRQARRSAKPRSIVDVAKKHAVAQRGDVMQMIEEQLAHHESQVAKLRKVLEVLREVA